MCHNPCFSGILFAIQTLDLDNICENSHNPCFSGILFAIGLGEIEGNLQAKSQSLF